MIQRISTILSSETNPYRNIALEELLLHTVVPGEVILYLWQNRNTVVIGRNQNARAECKAQALADDGGFLARRLSGGGAVFHDLGNLNFTFLACREDYDLERQMEVILQGVRLLGLEAERTGRNDIAIDGKKFSGNAFYCSGGKKYHHGTLLLSADMGRLQSYLTVDKEKLEAHGVQSVQARVVNLCQLDPTITVSWVQQALLRAFGEVYGLEPLRLDETRLDMARWATLAEKFASLEWRMGAEKDFSTTVKHRFGWGGVEVGMRISGGSIAETAVYTDALDADLAGIITAALEGCVYSPDAVTAALCRVYTASSETTSMVRDVAALLCQHFE